MSYFPPGGSGMPLSDYAEIIDVEQIAEISTDKELSDPHFLAKYKITGMDSGIGSRRAIVLVAGVITCDASLVTGATTGRFGFFSSNDGVSWNVMSSHVSITGVPYGAEVFALGSEQAMSGSAAADGFIGVALGVDSGPAIVAVKNARVRALLHTPAGATVTRLV